MMKSQIAFAALVVASSAAWAAATTAPAAAPPAAKPAAAAPAAKPAAAAPAAKPPAANALAQPRREELWFIARAADGAMAYDAKSIKVDPALSTVSIISLIYLKSGAKTAKGVTYNYILSEDNLDCIGPQFKPKSRLVFDIAGKVLDAGDAPPSLSWVPLKGNPPLNALRGVACSGATFKNMTQAPNFPAALKAMKEMK